MRRMGKIVGRSDDMLIIRGVNLFPSQVEELVLQQGQLTGHYQLVVTRTGHLDEVQVRCEVHPDHTSADRAVIAHDLQHHIKTFIGVSAQVEILDPGGVERSLGKARRVIDERPR
jgi:phenylacetate-CoA ligase